MTNTINLSDFRNEFHAYGRGEQFSYDGLEVLFDFLEDCYPDFELDVIGLCCDFMEGSITDILAEYDLNSVNDLENHTIVLYVNSDDIIIQRF